MSDPVAYVRIAEGETLPDITAHAPFRAVVVIDAPYSRDWQNEVSDWLVASGCLYMMAWGQDCSDWHDAVDWANIAVFDPGPVPDESHVMTTWHDDETLEEAFWYSQFCAHDPWGRIEHSVIVHVGEADRETEFLALYAQAKTFVDRKE